MLLFIYLFSSVSVFTSLTSFFSFQGTISRVWYCPYFSINISLELSLTYCRCTPSSLTPKVVLVIIFFSWGGRGCWKIIVIFKIKLKNIWILLQQGKIQILIIYPFTYPHSHHLLPPPIYANPRLLLVPIFTREKAVFAWCEAANSDLDPFQEGIVSVKITEPYICMNNLQYIGFSAVPATIFSNIFLHGFVSSYM